MKEKDFHREFNDLKEILGEQKFPSEPRRKPKHMTTQLDRIEKKVDKVLALLKALPPSPDDPRLAEATEAVKQNTENLKEAMETNTDPVPVT